MRLKVFATHPVQYHVPIWRTLVAQGIDVEVGYFHQGATDGPVRDEDFGTAFGWDVDLRSGYDARFFSSRPFDYSMKRQATALPGLLAWTLTRPNVPLLLVGWALHVFWMVWMLRTLMGAPTLLLCETTPDSYRGRGLRKMLLEWLLKRTSAVLFIGERNRVFLAAHGVSPDHLFHAPYSIDNARFGATASAMESTRRTLCESHGLDPSLSTFLFSGKLISKKRPLELFDAFVAAGLPSKAQLVYVGDGPLRGPLLERVRELGLSTVHVLGFLNQSEMPTAYAIGHVLCLLSDADETWGLVVNEAFACARPAIVSEVAGCAADLVFPETGWKVSVDGVLSIAATLERAWRDRDQWPQKGAAARRTVSMHSYPKMADGVIAALTHASCGGRRQLGVHAKELSP